MYEEILASSSILLVSLMVLLLARVAFAKMAPFDVEHELTEADNPAVGTVLFGYLAGLLIVIAGLLSTESSMPQAEGLPISDLAELGSYGLLAILLLKVAGLVNDKCILHRFENKKELVGDRNVGAGAVVAGSYIASGLVLAGAFSGRVAHAGGADGGTWFDLLLAELPIALAFFALGQVALVVLGFVYQAIQKEDVLDAIERDYEVDGVTFGGNAAAGIAFAGNMVALGVLLYGGARYDFVSWGENLSTFGVHVGAALVGLPLWRLLVDKIVLSKADLAKEIYEDRNVNAALVEGIFLVALAVILVFVL